MVNVFEPLQALLNKHGDAFTSHLASIRNSVSAVAGNTEALLARNQFSRKSVPVPAKKVAQLRNDSAYGWIVKWVATSATKVRIYVGTETEDSFMAELDPATAGCAQEQVEWYLPTGGVLFVKNTSEATDTFLNIEAEVMVSEAVEAHTGPSEERIEVERRISEPPDPQPLDVRAE